MDEEDQQSLLEHSEQPQEKGDVWPTQASKHSLRTLLTSSFISALVALTLGISIGRLLQPRHSRHGLIYPTGNIERKFQHNLTFTQRPENASEAAWASIIPVGRGFIHHDELAPFISNIAVFHQLHCLVSPLSLPPSNPTPQPFPLTPSKPPAQHAVVIAYYDALEAPSVLDGAETPDWDDATLTRIAIPHVRHCFDYLRQSLMCAADTNLEVLDHDTHVTNGWGQPKTCRDYGAVFAWAERYANSTDTGIVT